MALVERAISQMDPHEARLRALEEIPIPEFGPILTANSVRTALGLMCNHRVSRIEEDAQGGAAPLLQHALRDRHRALPLFSKARGHGCRSERSEGPDMPPPAFRIDLTVWFVKTP